MRKSELKANDVAKQLAINAANIAFNTPELMIVVNFKEPSYRHRLYVVEYGTVTATHHVAHGSGSASPNDKAYSTSFSNKINSHQSSLGKMKTGNIYHGRHGKSLRLDGLEPGKNSNVRVRYVVIHPSNYVTDNYILNKGRAGCSWGCLAVDPAISSNLIDKIKGGVPVYCYY